MKIGLYIQHGVGPGLGGAELMMAGLASHWSAAHEVDFIHHRPGFERERLSLFAADQFNHVRFRYVAREPDPPAFRNPLQRYRAAQRWQRSISEGYDLFVNCTHWLPSFCRARHGVLLVLFPFYIRPSRLPELSRLPIWKRLRHAAYYELEWRRRLATYRTRVAISEFAHDWTLRRWGISCDVVYPPVDPIDAVELAGSGKESLILSVGRFTTASHTKKQIELMQVFRELHSGGLTGWRYASVGGLNDAPENRAYFDRVQQLGSVLPAEVAANLPRAELRRLYARASIFWHATGFGDDTEIKPELAEHFGIATVEAMSAGCVPIVIDKGGQREIVEHGTSGFLWSTLGDLKEYTKRLVRDPSLRQRMSAAAKERARRFASRHFLDRMSQLGSVVLDAPGAPYVCTSAREAGRGWEPANRAIDDGTPARCSRRIPEAADIRATAGGP